MTNILRKVDIAYAMLLSSLAAFLLCSIIVDMSSNQLNTVSAFGGGVFLVILILAALFYANEALKD